MSTIDSFVSLLRIFNRNIWDKVDVPDVNEVEHSCIFWLFSVCYEYDLAGGLGCSLSQIRSALHRRQGAPWIPYLRPLRSQRTYKTTCSAQCAEKTKPMTWPPFSLSLSLSTDISRISFYTGEWLHHNLSLSVFISSWVTQTKSSETERLWRLWMVIVRFCLFCWAHCALMCQR